MTAWCGWPASQASGFGVGSLTAYDFAPNPVDGQNNPPTIETYDRAINWFSTAILFPVADLGGSWVQGAFLTSPYVDPSVDPYFSIAWCSTNGAGDVNWHIHYTCSPDGTAMAGGGPGTQFNQTTTGTDILQVTPEVQIAPTGIGSVWGPDSVINVNIYRGATNDTIAGAVALFNLRIRYKVL